MATLKYLCFRKVLLFLCFILFFFFSFASSQTQTLDPHFRVRRLLVKKDLEDDNDETNLTHPPIKKKKLINLEDDNEETNLTHPPVKKKKLKDLEDDNQETKKKKKLKDLEDEKEETNLTSVKKKKLKDLEDDNQETNLPSLVKKKKLKDLEDDNQETKKKKKLLDSVSSNSSTKKNQTKLIKPISSSSKNQTKLTKTGLELKKLNSTTKSSSSKTGLELKKLNSGTKTSNSSSPIKKSSPDLTKSTSTKNKTTTKPSNTKLSPPKSAKPVTKPEKEIKPFWLDDEEDEDFVSEFKDLPTKFQRSLIPDLERISTQSKNYINKANKEITKNFKPYFGNKYASIVAPIVSFIFLLVPLLLVSLVFNKFKAYFSLQKLLIFIQIYLSIYFTILCISSIVTGIEPLKFLYATSSSTYVGLQILQTLGYVFYLLLLLMYLVLVFSTDCGLGLKVLGLAQTFVGFAVGLHYYVAVFHRVVLRQPPKTNWKVHGVYATCFLLICLLSSAERRKKEYLEESGDEGKKN